jgi:hypothetical protein
LENCSLRAALHGVYSYGYTRSHCRADQRRKSPAANAEPGGAIDAGKFDPDKYEEFKKQLYEKSVNESLKCFEYFIEQNSHHDANMCLQTWKMHAKEIGIYDEPTYQEFVKRLNSLKENKPE